MELCCLQWGRRRVLDRAWEKWRERFAAQWEQKELDAVGDSYCRVRRLGVSELLLLLLLFNVIGFVVDLMNE